MRNPTNIKSGFTLIELSIVLVIIGLIIGGVLVGRDLISAATVRAQISQIEKYNAAVNTFRGKYGYLPGDIPDPTATQFGLASRGTNPGQGDGNGILEAWNGVTPLGDMPVGGELFQFWSDLTYANGANLNLIEGNFSSVTPTTILSSITNPNLGKYFPVAKIGQGNYLVAFSDGYWTGASYLSRNTNFFSMSAMTSISGSNVSAKPGLTVNQAYSIDLKIDDGMPQSGKVTARYLTAYQVYWVGTSYPSYGAYLNGFTLATPPTSSTCFDNGGVMGLQNYSLSAAANYGQGINCALVFPFQ